MCISKKRRQERSWEVKKFPAMRSVKTKGQTLITKPRSFNFINSHALLKMHAISQFFASESKICWTSRRRNIFNFNLSFATPLTMLLEITVSRWLSGGDFLVSESSSWLQINSDIRAILAGVRAVRIRSGGLRFEVPVRRTSVLSSVRKLFSLFNHSKQIKSHIALQNWD